MKYLVAVLFLNFIEANCSGQWNAKIILEKREINLDCNSIIEEEGEAKKLVPYNIGLSYYLFLNSNDTINIFLENSKYVSNQENSGGLYLISNYDTIDLFYRIRFENFTKNDTILLHIEVDISKILAKFPNQESKRELYDYFELYHMYYLGNNEESKIDNDIKRYAESYRICSLGKFILLYVDEQGDAKEVYSP